MGSFRAHPYLTYCHDCEDLHPTPHRLNEQAKSDTIFGLLPECEHPWITVKFGPYTIFANQDFAPYVLLPDGSLQVLKAHIPHAKRLG